MGVVRYIPAGSGGGVVLYALGACSDLIEALRLTYGPSGGSRVSSSGWWPRSASWLLVG